MKQDVELNTEDICGRFQIFQVKIKTGTAERRFEVMYTSDKERWIQMT